MENIIKWFDENKIFLEIFDEPKVKKLALVNNMLKLLAQETCYKCRSENVNNIFNNEDVIKLINFVSETNNVLVTQAPMFEYNGITYRVSTIMVEKIDDLISKINSIPGKCFIYNIFFLGDMINVRFNEEIENNIEIPDETKIETKKQILL